MSTIDDLANSQRPGIPDALEAAEALTELLALPSVGLKVTGGRIIGHGPSASADLRVSDGSIITFDTLREMSKPSELMLSVGIVTGAEPNLKATDARRAVILLRALAEIEETATNDTIATDWGLAFLADVDRLDVDLNDQGARYAAFAHLREIGESKVSQAVTGRTNVAQACTVLVDPNGALYVRAGWFYAYVRQTTNAPEGLIAQRMRRVGWQQPGSQGRIKATPQAPHSRPLIWTFLVAPAGWEDQVQVNSGERSNARVSNSRAHVRNTPPFTRSPDKDTGEDT